MEKTPALLVGYAAISLFIATVLGAVGSHALDIPADKMESWQLAVQYQMVHSLGMIMLSNMYGRYGEPLLQYAAFIIGLGIILFSGSIYVTTLGGPAAIGQAAPYGGSSFMLGWVLVAAGCIRQFLKN